MLTLLEGLSYAATIVGIPLAIVLFLRDRRKDRDIRLREIYSSVDDAYTDFLKILLDHPDVDFLRVSAHVEHLDGTESVASKRKRWILSSLLFSTFERAHLLYRQSPNDMLRDQWQGWEDWALDYLQRRDIQFVWERISPDFDAEFVAHMNTLLRDKRDT